MGNFGYGQGSIDDSSTEFGAVAFIVSQMIAEMSVMYLCKVTAITGGGVAPAGTVTVQPLVSQIDGNGYGTPHGEIANIPWSRVQGGKNAIICDPQVGDIGYVVTSDRDISKVKNTQAAANPGSRRRNDMSDGVYAGGCLNVAPNQYLIFNNDGVRLVDSFGNSYSSSSAGVNITDVNGNQMVTGAGFVNFITGALQVNGIPVTVP